ncbi:hypothetical protein IE53DRAFT_383280 [Violaceomyces palustris]|uniref:Uncharacterized protein n=1 Tax=Violaceomyces palustris TaxID=1673888 RepID=A0ACD0P7W1_9BASI|nr:hypothetical protein IE53DRAFT_383280 [Violaceomyces palustris]
MASLSDYLNGIRSSASTLNEQSLVAFFDLELTQYCSIKQDLQNHPRDLSSTVLQKLPASSLPLDSDRFQSLVSDFLAYVRDFPPVSSAPSLGGVNGSSQGWGGASASLDAFNDATDWVKAYEAWAMVYSRASNVFSMPETSWFIPSLRFFATSLVTLATTVDRLMHSAKMPKTTDAAGRLSKSAGLAGNDRTPAYGGDTKRAAVLMLANLSFKAYFKLNNTRLCETVVGSVENAFKINKSSALAVNSEGLRDDGSGESCFSRADRVTYRYYVGRLRFFQQSIRVASNHLRWAFDNCTIRQMKNKRLILIPLISSYLILGRYPEVLLLRQASLTHQFEGLVYHLKNGNGFGAISELDRNCDWFRAHGLYLILKEKLSVGIWRNLIRKTLVISRLSAPPSNAPPTIRLHTLLAAARLSWQDQGLDVEDVECIVSSLIDQGFIKGYVLHSKAMLVLQKGNNMGFPPMWQVFENR